MWGRMRIPGAAVVSAILLVLSLAPADHGWIGWLCLVPVLAAVRGRGFVAGFSALLATCLLAAFVTTTGIFYSGPRLAGLPTWHYLSFFLFGVPAGLVGALMGDDRKGTRYGVIEIAAWAVLAEGLLQVVLPANLALTQYRSATMLGIASITGIWGVSYLLWLANAGVAVALLQRRYAWALATVGAILVAGIPFARREILRAGLVSVAAVQQNEEEAVTLTPASGTNTPANVSDKSKAARPATRSAAQEVGWDMALWTKAASHSGAKLVVWPELSGMAGAAGGDTARLKLLSTHVRGAAFVTTFEDSASPRPHNAASLFEDGRESARYFKRRLFGGERVIHAAGDEPVAVPWRGTQVGLSICFDSCYPGIMRELASLPGVKLVVLPCGGPQTPFGVVEALHGTFTPFRSAEMGIPIVRSDVSGFSQVTDARGQILAEAPAGMQGPLIAEVVPESRPTLYRKFGDWFLWLCGVIVCAGIARVFRDRRRSASRPPDSVLPV